MSNSSGIVRKVYDVGPKAITSNGNYDGSSAPTTSWSSGINASEWLSAIAQGVTDNDRVGFSVAAESADLNLVVNPDISANAAGMNLLRIVIVADGECDGAFPVWTDVFGNAQQTDTTVATGLAISHLQPAYFGRFKVLMDEHLHWDVTSSTSGINHPRTERGFVIQRHFDLKDHRIMWDMSDSNGQANARKGHIFMLCFFQNVTTATGGLPTLFSSNPPSIQYSWRIRYRDA